MQRLDRKTMDRLSCIPGEIEAIYDAMDAKAEAYLAEIEALREQADDLRDEAFQHLDEAYCRADDYFNERSERWQEGEKGQSYGEWRDRLEGLRDDCDSLPEVVPIEIERPDFLDRIAACDYEEPEGL